MKTNAGKVKQHPLPVAHISTYMCTYKIQTCTRIYIYIYVYIYVYIYR